MIRFILRRTGSLILLLVAVSFITFTLFQLGPADPASAACGQECTPERIAEARVALGMDHPFFIQYFDYMRGLVSPRMIGAPGAESLCQWPCLGKSFQTNENVSDIIARSLPYTLSMAIGALVLWTITGVGLGLLAALRKGSATDKFIVAAASVGVSLPIPVTGLFLLLVFVNQLHLLPFTTNEINSPFGAQGPWAWVLNYFLPWVALAVLFSAAYIRVTRTNMIETFSEDFIRTARAKGLAPRTVTFKHGVRAGITPVVTMLGMDIGLLLGGAVLTEQIFSVPGLGFTAVRAAISGDLPVTMAITMLAAFFVIVANVVVDLAYAAIDPRVRLQ
ncbi:MULTISPECIES: ABC transporter permease [Arthrobacter]|uniref:ABC transporter permease n=1 Tax=Arthrobacter terricola TaxID=2547396 RepID=A0A4R5K523_9MICC|nr:MULTISPECIES: ABC transporter permease [Arthrobacter]MBT8163700.1 ABC transporter permease [Arthrobacter sp. GN70]TDF87531.1 ABC transporter permease [Arthrobacter terricola]